MEIKRQTLDGFEVLVLEGRLDAYWADHLENELSKSIREGYYKLMLDMSGVSYLSSAGIRVLLQNYKKLNQINGQLSLVNISESVQSVLRLSGVEALLKPVERKEDTPKQQQDVRKIESGHAVYEILHQDSTKILGCEIDGSAEFLTKDNKATVDSSIRITSDTYALGIGAFGNGYDDCKNRYGEFLAVGGAVSYLPTDGTNVADFHIASGEYMPGINALYSITCRGDFSVMARFEASKEKGAISLSSIVNAAFEISGKDTIAVAAVAESAGIVGANLIKSPVSNGDSEDNIFSFPNIQNCISFTSEKSYIGSLAVIFGIASKNPSGDLVLLLRPMDDGENFGHFHAMIFSYQPLMKGKLDLNETVNNLFERQSVQSVIHLLSDNRDIVGAGESEFIRGGLWISGIESVSKA